MSSVSFHLTPCIPVFPCDFHIFPRTTACWLCSWSLAASQRCKSACFELHTIACHSGQEWLPVALSWMAAVVDHGPLVALADVLYQVTTVHTLPGPCCPSVVPLTWVPEVWVDCHLDTMWVIFIYLIIKIFKWQEQNFAPGILVQDIHILTIWPQTCLMYLLFHIIQLSETYISAWSGR